MEVRIRMYEDLSEGNYCMENKCILQNSAIWNYLSWPPWTYLSAIWFKHVHSRQLTVGIVYEIIVELTQT